MSIKRYILSRTMMPSMNVTTRCCQLRQHIFTMLIANLKVIDIKTKTESPFWMSNNFGSSHVIFARSWLSKGNQTKLYISMSVHYVVVNYTVSYTNNWNNLFPIISIPLLCSCLFECPLCVNRISYYEYAFINIRTSSPDYISGLYLCLVTRDRTQYYFQ